MWNKREKRRIFTEYCKKVWLYLELEMMVARPTNIVDREDISFYFKAGNDVQTAAFLIKEIIS